MGTWDGAFAVVFPTFVLVSRMQLTQQYRDNGHFLIEASSSRHKAMVGGTLERASGLRVGLGVSEATSCLDRRLPRVWIVCSTITFVDFSLVDLIFISRYF